MDKFLFTDGTNGVREVHSKEELLALISSAPEPARARIWVFHSNEWISAPAFISQQPKGTLPSTNTNPDSSAAQNAIPVQKKRGWTMLGYSLAAVAAALLIFNFTRAGWEAQGSISNSTVRPANVPQLDTDSLALVIEWQRGKALDKGTRTNLRIRNNWPDYLQASLKADKEKKGNSYRLTNINISMDNTTGYLIDEAVIRILSWKNGKSSIADTVQFKGIRYDKVLNRQLNGSFRGDSLSLAIASIRAKSFNFCYSIESVSNNNPNDRWFCRDGKPLP